MSLDSLIRQHKRNRPTANLVDFRLGVESALHAVALEAEKELAAKDLHAAWRDSLVEAGTPPSMPYMLTWDGLTDFQRRIYRLMAARLVGRIVERVRHG